jgi:hypothetical protein
MCGGVQSRRRQKKLSKREQFLHRFAYFYQIGHVPCEQRISVINEFTLEYELV